MDNIMSTEGEQTNRWTEIMTDRQAETNIPTKTSFQGV